MRESSDINFVTLKAVMFSARGPGDLLEPQALTETGFCAELLRAGIQRHQFIQGLQSEVIPLEIQTLLLKNVS